MTKPLCILVDDESNALSSLKSNIKELDLLEIEKSYLDPDRFLVEIEDMEAEIIFLDMDMPISGDEVARKLKNKKVIFVSGYLEQAFKGFEVNAVDFVPKPIRLSRLKEAILKAIEKLDAQPENNLLVIKTQASKKEEIRIDSILYIESAEDARDKLIHLINDNPVIAKNINFDTILELLPNNFIRVNPQQVINLNHAYKLIDADTIGLKNESKTIDINLGNSFKTAFFEAKPHFK